MTAAETHSETVPIATSEVFYSVLALSFVAHLSGALAFHYTPAPKPTPANVFSPTAEPDRFVGLILPPDTAPQRRATARAASRGIRIPAQRPLADLPRVTRVADLNRVLPPSPPPPRLTPKKKGKRRSKIVLESGIFGALNIVSVAEPSPRAFQVSGLLSRLSGPRDQVAGPGGVGIGIIGGLGSGVGGGGTLVGRGQSARGFGTIGRGPARRIEMTGPGELAQSRLSKALAPQKGRLPPA